MFNREGRFDLVGSSHSSSESLSSLHSLDTALIPYEGAGRAEHDTEPHAPSSSEDRSVRKILVSPNLSHCLPSVLKNIIHMCQV